MPEQQMTVAEAARALGLTPSRVRQLCDAEELRCVRSPYGRLIPVAAVGELLLKRRAAGGAEKAVVHGYQKGD